MKVGDNVITLGKVVSGKATFEEYMRDCYERNKDGRCFRETNGHTLCVQCPKFNEDFAICPDCGCDEALITARGMKGGCKEGKALAYCPVCEQVKEVEVN